MYVNKCETFQVVPTDVTGSQRQQGGPIISAGVTQDQKDPEDLCALNCTASTKNHVSGAIGCHSCSEISHRAPIKRTARTRLTKHSKIWACAASS